MARRVGRAVCRIALVAERRNAPRQPILFVECALRGPHAWIHKDLERTLHGTPVDLESYAITAGRDQWSLGHPRRISRDGRDREIRLERTRRRLAQIPDEAVHPHGGRRPRKGTLPISRLV